MTTKGIIIVNTGGTIASTPDVRGLLRPTQISSHYTVNIAKDSASLSTADVKSLQSFMDKYELPVLVTYGTDTMKGAPSSDLPVSERLRISQEKLLRAAEAAKNEIGIVGKIAREILEEFRNSK